MSALSEDRPRFEQLDPEEAAKAAEEYRRVWGEAPPESPAVSDQQDTRD